MLKSKRDPKQPTALNNTINSKNCFLDTHYLRSKDSGILNNYFENILLFSILDFQ